MLQRRKVQNRAAQRAYRERKEKAFTDLREQLEEKETQFQALQADHKQLQEQFEKMRAAKYDHSSLGMTVTCDPSDILPAMTGKVKASQSSDNGQGVE